MPGITAMQATATRTIERTTGMPKIIVHVNRDHALEQAEYAESSKIFRPDFRFTCRNMQ
jgi:hypothetical protein